STGIDYNEKTISWNLTINPIREPITELKITDTFPSKGLILLPDTLEVKQGSKTLTKGVDYTLVPNTEEGVSGYHKGFILTFTGGLPLNANTSISYKTSYDPQVEVGGNHLEANTDANRYYRNRALFEGKTKSGATIGETRDASRQVIIASWNSGKK